MPSGQSSSVCVHTNSFTYSHTPSPVFLINPQPLQVWEQCSCCFDLISYEQLEKCVLCLHCGKRLLQVTQIHQLPCYFSSSLSRFCFAYSSRWREEKKGETKEAKQRSALFEIIFSFTSYFSLLLKQTHSHIYDTVVTQGSKQCELGPGLR